MKIYVAYDAEGKILAAVNLSERVPENGTASYPRLVLREGNATPKSKCPKNTGI
jgi:hypothetical protein